MRALFRRADPVSSGYPLDVVMCVPGGVLSARRKMSSRLFSASESVIDAEGSYRQRHGVGNKPMSPKGDTVHSFLGTVT